MSSDLSIERHQVRITVLRKHFHKDFVERYAANPELWTECKQFQSPRLKVGDRDGRARKSESLIQNGKKTEKE